MMNKKKKLGQFFTNEKIARIMVKWVLGGNPKSVLDPAVGPGIFLKEIEMLDPFVKKYACEIDSNMIDVLLKNKVCVEVSNEDYLEKDYDEKYDAIICNPPYNKFQEIEKRKFYIEKFKEFYGINMSGYSNLCVYFLIKSINELNENGRCCYIIPYEFLNTGYGVEIKKYLLDRGLIDAIIKFDNSLKLFEDAITTSCIMFIEKKVHKGIHFININNLEEFQDLEFENLKKLKKNIFILNDELDIKEKWLKYFDFEKCEDMKYRNLIKFSNICKVKRGIATGNNNFFVLNKSTIKKYGLSESVCVPCITKAPDVKNNIFNEEAFYNLTESDKKVYLFDGTKAKSINDYNYIKNGELDGVNKSYLTSHRKPWYALEERKPAPIWVSVFSRGKIKVIRNEMLIKNLTTFHGLYFNNDDFDEDRINLMYCYLLTPIAQEILYLNKREYGEGLDKFEPNDLNDAYVFNIECLANDDKKYILDIYEDIRKNDNVIQYIECINNVFKKYIL